MCAFVCVCVGAFGVEGTGAVDTHPHTHSHNTVVTGVLLKYSVKMIMMMMMIIIHAIIDS